MSASVRARVHRPRHRHPASPGRRGRVVTAFGPRRAGRRPSDGRHPIMPVACSTSASPPSTRRSSRSSAPRAHARRVGRLFDPPADGRARPSRRSATHIARRLTRAALSPAARAGAARPPRPEWVDDRDFDLAGHVHPAADGAARTTLAERCCRAARARPAAVGDVDRRPTRGRPHRHRGQGPPLHGRRHGRRRARLAAARPTPEAPERPTPAARPPAAATPTRRERLRPRGARPRPRLRAELVRRPARAGPSRAPRSARSGRSRAPRCRSPRRSPLNRPGSPHRRLARVRRP